MPRNTHSSEVAVKQSGNSVLGTYTSGAARAYASDGLVVADVCSLLLIPTLIYSRRVKDRTHRYRQGMAATP